MLLQLEKSKSSQGKNKIKIKFKELKKVTPTPISQLGATKFQNPCYSKCCSK